MGLEGGGLFLTTPHDPLRGAGFEQRVAASVALCTREWCDSEQTREGKRGPSFGAL